MAKGTKKAKHWGVTVGIILAVILALALSLSVLTSGFRDWTKLKPDQTEQSTDGEQTTGGLVMPEETQGNGIALMSAPIAKENYEEYGISPQAETAYTLTATITPENADDKRVEWTVAPVSGNTNATEYITLTANGLTATVACKKAFDVQFIVTVKSLDNPNATATCTLDYVERLLDATVTVPKLSSTTGTVTYTPISSKYTVACEKEMKINNFVFNREFDTAFQEVANNVVERTTFYCIYDYTNKSCQQKGNGFEFSEIDDYTISSSHCPTEYGVELIEGLFGCFYYMDDQGYYEGRLGDAITAFRTASTQKSLGTIDVTITSKYGGKEYGSVKKTVEIWADSSAFHVTTEDVSLSKDSLTF